MLSNFRLFKTFVIFFLLLLANYYIYSMGTPCISLEGLEYAAVIKKPQNLDDLTS